MSRCPPQLHGIVWTVHDGFIRFESNHARFEHFGKSIGTYVFLASEMDAGRNEIRRSNEYNELHGRTHGLYVGGVRARSWSCVVTVDLFLPFPGTIEIKIMSIVELIAFASCGLV